MKLQFKHQKFQMDAAKTVCGVFVGQPYQASQRYLIDMGKYSQLDFISSAKTMRLSLM